MLLYVTPVKLTGSPARLGGVASSICVSLVLCLGWADICSCLPRKIGTITTCSVNGESMGLANGPPQALKHSWETQLTLDPPFVAVSTLLSLVFLAYVVVFLKCGV